MDYTSNPTDNELTALLNEERYARTLANIARRAQNLWADGYTARLTMKGLFVTTYRVTTPAGDHYSVKLGVETETPGSFFGDSCSCPAFAKYGTCKHLLALQWQRREEAQAAAFDAMMENAEGIYGCDPHTRW